jgi:hypothetical protein
MPDRQPEPWETNAAAPFLTLERERGTGEIWALGSDRFAVRALANERLVVGFDTAREIAHLVAGPLD